MWSFILTIILRIKDLNIRDKIIRTNSKYVENSDGCCILFGVNYVGLGIWRAGIINGGITRKIFCFIMCDDVAHTHLGLGSP